MMAFRADGSLDFNGNVEVGLLANPSFSRGRSESSVEEVEDREELLLRLLRRSDSNGERIYSQGYFEGQKK